MTEMQNNSNANNALRAYTSSLRQRFGPGKRLLLVQAPQFLFETINPEVIRNRGYYAYPPTGLQRLAASLSGRDIEIKNPRSEPSRSQADRTARQLRSAAVARCSGRASQRVPAEHGRRDLSDRIHGSFLDESPIDRDSTSSDESRRADGRHRRADRDQRDGSVSPGGIVPLRSRGRRRGPAQLPAGCLRGPIRSVRRGLGHFLLLRGTGVSGPTASARAWNCAGT